MDRGGKLYGSIIFNPLETQAYLLLIEQNHCGDDSASCSALEMLFLFSLCVTAFSLLYVVAWPIVNLTGIKRNDAGATKVRDKCAPELTKGETLSLGKSFTLLVIYTACTLDETTDEH